MTNRKIIKIVLCIVIVLVLCTRLLSHLGSNQREYYRCAKQSVEGKDWLNIALNIKRSFDDGSTLFDQYFVSYNFDKKNPRLFICLPNVQEYYMISEDCLQMIDKENQELTKFQKTISLRQTYSVMKNQVLGKIQYLPYYLGAMPKSLQPNAQSIQIKQSIDSIVNGNATNCFIGYTPKVYMKSEKTNFFTEPIQYQCTTWINTLTFHVDSVIAYNITDNKFHDTTKYYITEWNYIDKSDFYDILFDETNREYQNYSVHNEKNLPYSMRDSNNESPNESVLQFPFIGLRQDTITLNEIEGWALLDLWQFGCQPCYEGFKRLKQERDSLNQSILKSKGIRIIAVNANSNNKELIQEVANKYDANDLFFAGKGFLDLLALVNQGFPSYYLITPEKEIIWRSNYLGDYSELLEAKAEYEKQHKTSAP